MVGILPPFPLEFFIYQYVSGPIQLTNASFINVQANQPT
jgi:hypothetical protein